MSDCNWTPDQQSAIDARGVQTLVSAAAGSGKTAVLTERVKNIICDTENPCRVDELLVVTFTKAAAAEMRDRIGEALLKEIAENKKDAAYLKNQLLLLPTADICTIDSFCTKVVRENFNLARVSPDFDIFDPAEHDSLLIEIAEKVLENAYSDDSEAFDMLASMFVGEKDDSSLADIIIKLYTDSRCYQFPKKWLEDVCAEFSAELTPDNTKWSEVVFNYAEMMFDYYLKAFKDMLKRLEADSDFKPAFLDYFTLKINEMDNILQQIRSRSWDGFVYALRELTVSKKTAGSKTPDKPLKTESERLVSKHKTAVEKLQDFNLPDTAQHREDCEMLYPCCKKLCELVNRFSDELDEVKLTRNAYSFDDILHKCIELLAYVSDDGRFCKTELAKSLSEKYKEILIDEYQDTNEAQNIVFEMISREKSNFYCVGDVKQSIYRFRLASPELFIALCDAPTEADGKKILSKIHLKQNFRSRKGITECVNFLFSRLMTSPVGEIDYTEDDYLNFGAKYPDKDTPDITVRLSEQFELNADDAAIFEARQIAEYIHSAIESGAAITKKGKTEPVKPGDFCILLRAFTKASVYAEALTEKGISCNFVTSAKVGKSKEIFFLTSLLKVISNPLLDIPLAAVMMSPVFGFTPDELAELRIENRKGELYRQLIKREETDEKVKKFLSKIKLYRNISSAYTIYDFVKYIIDDSGLADIYLTYGNADQRTASIKAFLNIAYKFSQDGRTGLNSFIRYTDRLIESDSLEAEPIISDSEDSVKILTIHKSKGLEFPYVILPQCSRDLQARDSSGDILISRKTGIGIKVRNDTKLVKHHSLSSAASKINISMNYKSEELRVLYVALTRAKENLVLFCTFTKATKLADIALMRSSVSLYDGFRLHPYAVYSGADMAEWLLACLSFHPDCAELTQSLGFEPENYTPAFKMDFKLIGQSENESENDTDTQSQSPAQPDEDMLRLLKDKTDFTYSYDELDRVLAKRTASSLESGKEAYLRNYAKPSFAKDKLTGAQKGTAVHKFLEICDFSNAAADSEAEASRLFADGRLTETEYAVIDHEAVKAFFDCPVGKMALNAETVEKEYEFSVLRKAGELYPELPDKLKNEEIVVEGKIDCAFIKDGIAYIVDYKTDNISDEDKLIAIYSAQVKMYGTAFTECKGITDNNYKCYIYSFKLRKFIEI